MPASMYDQLLNPPSAFLAPLLALNEMTMRLYGEVSKEQIRVINELLLCHAEQLQELSQAKKVEQMVQIQGEFMAKAAGPLNAYAQHMIDALLEGNAGYAKWLEESIKQNTQAFKETIKEGKQLQEKAMAKK